MLEHLIPPMNALKCPLCKGGVFVESWVFLVSGTGLVVPFQCCHEMALRKLKVMPMVGKASAVVPASWC